MAVSAPVNSAVEAIESLFANFKPTHVMNDIDPMLEHLPDVVAALKRGITTMAERLDEQPVHPAVKDALRDLIPLVAGLEDAAKNPHEVFRQRHAQEREQHLNPRAGEKNWNLDPSQA
jgi:hypothetical protein